MKLFNIGILELLVILIIALIVLGPDGIVKTARTLGKTIRKIIRSPIWSMMIDTQRELREMPTKLVREAGLEEDLAEIRKTTREVNKIGSEVGQTNAQASKSLYPPTAYQPPEKSPIRPEQTNEESASEAGADASEGESLPETPQPNDLAGKESNPTGNKNEPH